MTKVSCVIFLFTILSLLYPSYSFATWSKYPNNPVLDIDQTQSWEAGWVDRPMLLYENNVYKMWYSGINNGRSHIGYAESADGITFTRYQNNPIISADIIDNSDLGVDSLSIVKRNNKYYGWLGRVSNPLDFDIYYTTSDDALNWNVPVPIVLDNLTSWDSQYRASPAVIYDQSSQVYKLWYSAYGSYNGTFQWRIGHAFSADGINWSKHPTPVLYADTGWESNNAADVGVIYENGSYYMWYHGLTGIGQATSLDGINWTKDSSNPILVPDPNGFDSKRILKPFVVKKDNQLYLYYAGIGSDDKRRIGLAINSDPLPTPIATPTPTITPTPTGPDNSPIVIMAGMGASWNLDDISSCSLSSSHDWTITPHVNSFERLIQTLTENDGMELNRDVYLYTYDWRQPLDTQDDLFEQFLTNTVLAGKPAETTVSIVAHSFGGLVARSYLSQHPDPDDHKIERLLTVGTPHQGSVLIYPAWENGTFFENNLIRKSLFNLLIRYCGKRGAGLSKRDVVQTMIPSLRHMLPTFDYIKRNAQIVPTANLFYQNDWIGTHPVPADLYDTTISTLTGESVRTIRFLDVVDPKKNDVLAGDWKDGKPQTKEIITEGDGAVLLLSGQLAMNGVTNQIISAHHDALLSTNAGLERILAFLGLPRISLAPSVAQPEITSNSMLSVISDQSVELTLELDAMKKTSKDRMAALFDPKEGKYTLTATSPVSQSVTLIFSAVSVDEEEPQMETAIVLLQKDTPKKISVMYTPSTTMKLKITP